MSVEWNYCINISLNPESRPFWVLAGLLVYMNAFMFQYCELVASTASM
jgi:hypothetical protein